MELPIFAKGPLSVFVMKSCLGILIMASALALIVGGGGLLYYLSRTAEFTRVDGQSPQAVPKAEPAR